MKTIIRIISGILILAWLLYQTREYYKDTAFFKSIVSRVFGEKQNGVAVSTDGKHIVKSDGTKIPISTNVKPKDDSIYQSLQLENSSNKSSETAEKVKKLLKVANKN